MSDNMVGKCPFVAAVTQQQAAELQRTTLFCLLNTSRNHLESEKAFMASIKV